MDPKLGGALSVDLDQLVIRSFPRIEAIVKDMCVVFQWTFKKWAIRHMSDPGFCLIHIAWI